MKRRQILASIVGGIIVHTTGCVENRTETRDNKQINDANQKNSSGEQTSAMCSFHVSVIEKVPNDASVTSAAERKLLDLKIFRRMFEYVNSDRELRTERRPSGEYDVFDLTADSGDDTQEAQSVLDSLPEYHNDKFPSGAYIKHDDIVLAVTMDCPT